MVSNYMCDEAFPFDERLKFIDLSILEHLNGLKKIILEQNKKHGTSVWGPDLWELVVQWNGAKAKVQVLFNRIVSVSPAVAVSLETVCQTPCGCHEHHWCKGTDSKALWGTFLTTPALFLRIWPQFLLQGCFTPIGI